MGYEIVLTASALRELEAIRVFDRRRILDVLRRQLSQTPTVATRNRKCLLDASASFEYVPPIWELRVGDYRVFYDVNETARQVYVRAVRLKQPWQTTGDVLR